MKQQREQVFISYSHKDKEWLEKLRTMLKPLVRNQTINVWDDTKIQAGSQWKDEIKNALAAAKIAVLIVSPNFLASDFIAEHELSPLLQEAEQEGLTIIWVYVSSCLYNETEIGNYQAAHDISRPLKGLSEAELDNVLVDICQKIKDLIRERKPLIPNRENSSAQSKDIHLDRSNVEILCFEEIMIPGAVIRIKGGLHIGKTSLLRRILKEAKTNNFLAVYLGFQEFISHEDFPKTLDDFLKRFCSTISESLNDILGDQQQKIDNKLQLSNNLDRDWDPNTGAKTNCKNYLKKNLLSKLSNPLVLGLDDVSLLCNKNPEIAEDFFALLRGCHEIAKHDDTWGNLRLVLAYSRHVEVIKPQQFHISPLNMGNLLITSEELEFTSEHVLQLAKLHHLNWDINEIKQLMTLVSGYPFFINEALTEISRRNISLEQLLAKLSLLPKIREHLDLLWRVVRDDSDLRQIMYALLKGTDVSLLDSIQVERLQNMGLLKELNNFPVLSCQLYRQYFSQRLL
jgi:hypothetical protein